MHKFQVGDEVKILPFKELKKHATKWDWDTLYFPDHTFIVNSEMKEFCGKKAKVVEAFQEWEYMLREMVPCYRLEIDNQRWVWIEEWLQKA